MRISSRTWLSALCAAAVLSGCSSTSQPPAPAPVETRTRPPAKAAPAVAAPAQPAKPTGAPAPATSARSEPVRSAGVQVRPLDPQSRPQDRAAESRPAAAADQVRTQPQGLKRPYSESAAAEMRGTTGSEPPSQADAGKGEAAPAEGPATRPDPKVAARPEAKAEAKAEQKSDSGGGFAWPARGRIIQGFSEPKNMGIAIAGNPGDPVQAVADGRVIFSGPGPRGYGNLLIVKHDSETLSVYAHNRALLVKDGAQVKRGQQIAELGESGTDRPKLHFEIRKSGRPVDPMKLLPAR